MKKNQLKLFTYWKENSIISYHNRLVTNSFRVKNIKNISLKFLNSCWIKKWNSLEDLKLNLDDSIIAISFGGYFVNSISNLSIFKENVDLNFFYSLDNLSKTLYLDLLNTLLNLINLINKKC